MKKQFTLLFSLLLCGVLLAEDNLLSQAKYLFDNGKYSASQSILSQLSSRNSNITAEIMYLNAKCSKELFLTDAISIYSDLNLEFPYHKFRDEVNKDLALIYYREKQYDNAITSFLKVKYLSNEELFKLAYANFCIGYLDEAQLYFSKIMNTDSKFASTSRYYYAFIEYKDGFFQSALESFRKLLDDKKFGVIAPYYISQIYFYQKEYVQLIAFAKPLSKNIIASRKSEINRLLAEAFYRTNDFKNAINHFEVFINEEKDVSSLVYFLLGHSYFKSANYEYAISNLEHVSNAADSVMQYSAYYLGASYLQLANYNYALQAFKKSASYDYNKNLQQDAYYSYAKLSYQLELPFDNSLQILTDYLEIFKSPIYEPQIKTLIAQTFQATSQYSEAYVLLKDIYLPSFKQKKALQQLGFFLGVREFNQQNFKEAIIYFSNANKYPINDTYSYLSNFWMSDCYFHLGDYNKSIDGYSRLTISSVDNLSYYENLKNYNLAYSYFQTQDYINAVKWFRIYEKAASDSMKINDTYLRIADGYFMTSNFYLSNKYYDKALEINLFDTDYALYQNSLSLGLISKDTSRIKLLKRIILDFTNSSYYDNSLNDLAEYYKNNSDYELAKEYYDSLILSTDDDDLIANAYLSKGMINFNSGKIELAIDEFLFVVNNYQKTKYFKESLSALQSAYSSLARIDEYLIVVESLPEISITKLEQDSLTYNTAFMKFSEMDYEVSKNAFDKYLQTFENGFFINDARYYNAISSLKVGDTINAVINYQKVLESNSTNHKENSLIFLARRSYNSGDYEKSNIYYAKLSDFASSNSIKRELVIRLMMGNEHIDRIVALKYAKQVIELDKTDNWLLSKAYIIIARNEFDSGNYAKSKSTFKTVSNLSFYDEGAEAKYFLAYLTYLDDSLELAEQSVFSLAEEYNNDHFIAKAFILLSDIYIAQGNIFQAKATLESIIENHDDDGLVNIARKKLCIILESEKELLISDVKQESFIEISEDDFEYEVKEIDEEYIVPLPNAINIDADTEGIINDNILEDEFK
jgi:tetratricopeptide (TPR) repeat protein